MAGKAGDVVINLTIRAASFSQGLDKARGDLDRMAGAADNTGGKVLQFQKKMETAGHGTVNSLQAVSGGLRFMEGGMHNLLRSAERFATMIPGVADAMKAIFPAIGAIAIANMFYEGEQRVQKFIEKINQMPKAIEQGFEAMHQHSRLANDELAVTNDKLEIEIAKLEGKPENGLALALDEARVNADKLVASVEAAQQAVASLLKEQSPGFFGAMLGKVRTGAIAGTINAFDDQLTDIQQKRQDALYHGDTAGADRYQHEYTEKLLAMKRTADALVADNPRSKSGFDAFSLLSLRPAFDDRDNNANRNAAIGMQKLATDALEQAQQQQRNLADQAEQKKAQAAKDAAERAKQQAAEAKRLRAEAAREQMEAFEHGANELQMAGEGDVYHERNYWAQKLATLQQGSANYNRVFAKVAEATKQMDAELQKSLHQHHTGQADAFAKEQEHQADEQMRRVAEIRQQAADQLAKLQERGQLSDVGIALAHGEISRYEAAVTEARIHAAAFDAEIADVEKRLAEAEALRDLPGAQELIAKLQGQLAQLRQQAAQQKREDDSATNMANPGNALGDAFRQWSQQATDAAETIHRAFQEAARGINDSLASALTDPARTGAERMQHLRNGLGNTFHGLANQGINFGLAKMESMLPGGLGKIFGGGKKPTGASGDPLYVKNADAQLGGGLAGLNLPGLGLPNVIGPAGAAAASGGGGGIGGFVTGVVSHVLPFLGFAGGGPIAPDMGAFLVGEDGPEILNVGHASAHVTPNSALKSFGGGDVQHNYHIDARGADNPAATEAAVMRGIRQAAPHIARMGMEGTREDRLRRPTNAGAR